METNVTAKKELKAAKKSNHASLRVCKATGRAVKQVLDQINKKDFGKRVGADALIARIMTRLTQSDISELQEGSLTHKNRFDREYVRYVSQHGKISRDEYLGLVMSGKIAASGETKKTAENS